MADKIDGYINKLDQLAEGGIKEDHLHNEFKDIIDTLDSIKKENKKGEPSKEQLNKIIKFLNEQTKTIPNGNFTMINKLNGYKEDFQNLLNQREKESNKIKKESGKNIDRVLDELIAKGTITEETNGNKRKMNKKTFSSKPQNNFTNSGKETFEANLDLNNSNNYTVKSGDNLWNIVKAHYPKFTKTNKDIIHIINYIVNLNLELNPKKLKHLGRDDKLAWGVKGADGIAGDNIRIGDILKLPKIKPIKKIIKTVIHSEKIAKQKKPEENIKIKNNWEKVGFSQNGENYIIGNNGEPKLITSKELTPEFRKSLEKYQDTLVLSDNISLLLSALKQSGKDVSKELLELQNTINSFNPSELAKSNTKIQLTISSIFRGLDISDKEDIKIEDRNSVLKYIRDGLDNYEFVRKNIVDRQFESLTKISNKELSLFIKNPTANSEKIKKILGEDAFKEFQTEIIDKNAEADTYFIENKKELQKQFPTVNIDAIKDFITDSFVGTFAKIKISEIFIEKNLTNEIGYIIKGSEYNGKGNDDIDLLADIQGIGDWDFSDKNVNLGYEGFKLIATEIAAIAAGMLTMGVGTYAVNAAVYGNRAYKGIKALQAGGRLANASFKGVSKGKILLAKTSRFTTMSAIEGGSFYAGYGALQSGVEGKNMYTMDGLVESVAFMGAFKALNGLYKIAGLKIDPSKPLIEQKIILGKQLIGDGVTFSALGLGFEGILFEPGEWTAETIVQAFVMAAAFRGAGVTVEKFKFKNKKDGGVEAIEEVKELTPKKIDSLFEKQFTKEINSEGQIQIGEKIYKKRIDGKYEISGDNNLYTKKEILKKISLDDKRNILTKTAKTRVSELESEKIIKLKDGIFDWKGKYKVSKDEIIIKENGKERKLTKEEETQFYKDNYQEILNKFGFNLKKDSEVLVNKIKEKLSGSKGYDMVKSINNFLESIPALGHLYKGGKWLGKQGINSMLTPVNIIKNIKNAKGFEETLKSIIFANKDIGYIKGVGKVGGMVLIPTLAEILYETNTTPKGSMSLSAGNIAANYGEMMYLGVINTLIIEGFNVDEWVLNETQ